MKTPQQLSQEIIDIIKATGNYFVGNTSGMSNDGTVNVYHPKGYSISAIAANPISSGEVIVFKVNDTWYAFGEQRTVVKQDVLIQRKLRASSDVIYPVITLFSIDQTFENSFEKETRRIYLGGNKISKRMTARNGEEIEFIDIPFKINGNLVLSSNVKGFISNKNIYFNYKTDNSNIFLSIIQGQKYLVSLDGVIGTPENTRKMYVGTKYLGDGVWESPEWNVTNQIVIDTPAQVEVAPGWNTHRVNQVVTGNHTVVVNSVIQNYSYNETAIYAFALNRIQFTREYQTWNGSYKESVELTGVTLQSNIPGTPYRLSWLDKWDINAPFLNFKTAYFLQEFKANVTFSTEGGSLGNPYLPPEPRIYTQEVNKIKLISKNINTPGREINSDDFVRVKSYTLESELTINSISLTLYIEITNYSGNIQEFQSDFMIGMPILFSRAIELDNYLIYGNISSASINFLPSPDVLTITISITKKVKRPCSFQGLLSNNGSFYSYYYKNNPPVNFMCKQIFADGEPNLFRQYFDSESVVRLDSLKGNEIYSVISSRRDLEGKILGEIYNTVYIEVWKITEDGKILYSNLITANYNNLKESRTDFKNIYAHNYHP